MFNVIISIQVLNMSSKGSFKLELFYFGSALDQFCHKLSRSFPLQSGRVSRPTVSLPNTHLQTYFEKKLCEILLQNIWINLSVLMIS